MDKINPQFKKGNTKIDLNFKYITDDEFKFLFTKRTNTILTINLCTSS